MPERNAPAIMQKNADLTWKRQPLYDTFITAAGGAGVAVVPFFQVPINTIGSGFAVAKTINETNMSSVGQVGKPNQFLLEGFQINVVMPPVGAVNLCDADFQAVYNSGLFRFIRGTNKVELEIPLDRIPTGPGPDGFATTATAGVPLGVIRITNGVPHISHYYNFSNPGEGKEPILIDGDQTFRCELAYGGVAGNLITAGITRIKCYMIGVYGQEQ